MVTSLARKTRGPMPRTYSQTVGTEEQTVTFDDNGLASRVYVSNTGAEGLLVSVTQVRGASFSRLRPGQERPCGATKRGIRQARVKAAQDTTDLLAGVLIGDVADEERQ